MSFGVVLLVVFEALASLRLHKRDCAICIVRVKKAATDKAK